MPASSEPVLIVGAGVAGLACARKLAASGRPALVLDKSRGVGGRCATRRVDGVPVDHGLAFLHGDDPGFLEEVAGTTGATPLPGWPRRIQGRGRPCQPGAFDRGQQRRAFAEGIKAFPAGLARGLDVRTGQRVAGLESLHGGWRVLLEGGGEQAARDVVLALPGEQARALLAPPAGDLDEVAAACELLRLAGSLPCLTLLAGYPPEAPAPPWDMLYPEDSAALLLISHDSSKRPRPAATVLVLQARPAWSRRRLEAGPEEWTALLLAEAARVAGAWAGEPAWTQSHRWRLARVDRGSELSRPLLLPGPGGGRLGLAGELFARGGGVQAAWLSGRALARRLLQEE